MKKIAIVGATGFATEKMLPELSHSNECKVVAILSRDAEKLKKVAKDFLIEKFFTDISEMFRADNYDAVYIATPPHQHLSDIKNIVRFKTAILCEKPIARNLKESKEIKKVLKAYSKSFMIGHHIRHQKAVIDIKKIIDNKEIGEVVSAYGQWSYQLNPLAPYAKWKSDRKLGGYSVINDPGVHIIDLMYAFFGLPVYVSANGFSAVHKTTTDNAVALLGYENMNAIVESSQTADDPKNDLVIYGTNGTVMVPECFSQTYIPKIIIMTKEGKRELKYEPTYLYKNEMEDLLDLKTTGISGTTLNEVLDEMLIVEAINTSLDKKKMIHLKDLS